METQIIKKSEAIIKQESHIYALLVLFFLLYSCISDITQYKRIGDTEYYLVESFGNESYADLRYRKDADDFFSESIKYRGFAKDVYWNSEYIIIKCTEKNSREITNYCIIKQYSKNNSHVPWEVHEYATEMEFEDAKQLFNLDEEKMNHTNADIPWHLH